VAEQTTSRTFRTNRATCARLHLKDLYTLIETCRLNDVNPRAWLADVLARLLGHPVTRLDKLLPWIRQTSTQRAAA